MEIEPKYKVIAVIEIVSAGALFLFWLGYYLIGFTPIGNPYFYSKYQNAIPFFDLCLALFLIIAAVQTLKMEKKGMLLSKLSAAAFVFLGIVGLEFKMQSGIHLISMVNMLSSGFVNLWCIVLGMFIFLTIRKKPQ